MIWAFLGGVLGLTVMSGAVLGAALGLTGFAILEIFSDDFQSAKVDMANATEVATARLLLAIFSG